MIRRYLRRFYTFIYIILLLLFAKLMTQHQPAENITGDFEKRIFRWTFSDLFIEETVTTIARKLNFSGFPQKNAEIVGPVQDRIRLLLIKSDDAIHTSLRSAAGK